MAAPADWREFVARELADEQGDDVFSQDPRLVDDHWAFGCHLDMWYTLADRARAALETAGWTPPPGVPIE